MGGVSELSLFDGSRRRRGKHHVTVFRSCSLVTTVADRRIGAARRSWKWRPARRGLSERLELEMMINGRSD